MASTEPPKPVAEESLNALFYEAHTEHGFTDEPVDVELLQKAIEMAQLPPTSFNCSPIRVIFVRKESTEEKEKLIKCLNPENVQQTREAAVTAILAVDEKYTEKIPFLMPFFPNARAIFESTDKVYEDTKMRNGHIQGAYLILALRALGLGVGPMGGFDNKALDEAFNLQEYGWKSNFLLNIGHPRPDARNPRAPRFKFEDIAIIL